MDVGEDGEEALPRLPHSSRIGCLPLLPEGRNVIAGPRRGEGRQQRIEIVAVLRLVVFAHGLLADITEFCRCGHRNPPLCWGLGVWARSRGVSCQQRYRLAFDPDEAQGAGRLEGYPEAGPTP